MLRRRFLQYAAGLAAAGFASRGYAASEKVRVACVGVRGQGNNLLRTFAAQPDVVITHLCDIDESVRGRRATETEKDTRRAPKQVKDYRTILDDQGVDVLVVGTPDHWHALPTIHGCMAGKDIYVEKPDGHNILEGRAMVAAARKHNRMVQLGTQARSAPDLFEAVEYVKKGSLGKVIYGRAWETDYQRPVPAVADS